MGQSEKDQVAFLRNFFHLKAAQGEVAEAAQGGKEVGKALSGGLAHGQVGQPDCRMAEEDAHQFHPRIAGSPDDRDPDHSLSSFRKRAATIR